MVGRIIWVMREAAETLAICVFITWEESMENNIIAGFHHLTAIVGDPQQNVDFYTRVLGQRLVKRTVNFDDPGTYHLYYGDEVGTPGTIITFFPWPGAPTPRGRCSATPIRRLLSISGSIICLNTALTSRVQPPVSVSK